MENGPFIDDLPVNQTFKKMVTIHSCYVELPKSTSIDPPSKHIKTNYSQLSMSINYSQLSKSKLKYVSMSKSGPKEINSSSHSRRSAGPATCSSLESDLGRGIPTKTGLFFSEPNENSAEFLALAYLA